MRLLHARAGRVPAASALLSFEEIERFVRIAVTLGIDKVRLTGGEPLVRRNIPALVEKLAAIPGLKDIGLTTNGILLAPMAQALRDAGLERINISLDTMDAAKFERLTRRTGFEQVIEGILAAKEAGFRSGKDQCRRHARRDRRRCRSARPVCPNSWPGAAFHRIHAARRRPSLGAREGLVRGRHSRFARPWESGRSSRLPTRIRVRPPSITNMPTAAAGWASSPRSAGPSA